MDLQPLIEEAYIEYLEYTTNGMLKEFFPELTGYWSKDAMKFFEFYCEREIWLAEVKEKG